MLTGALTDAMAVLAAVGVIYYIRVRRTEPTLQVELASRSQPDLIVPPYSEDQKDRREYQGDDASSASNVKPVALGLVIGIVLVLARMLFRLIQVCLQGSLLILTHTQLA